MAPISVVFAAMTRSRLKLRLWRIAGSPVLTSNERTPLDYVSAAPAVRSGKRNLRLRS
jgi:hypothetical protein